jgi:hypothetical protein
MITPWVNGPLQRQPAAVPEIRLFRKDLSAEIRALPCALDDDSDDSDDDPLDLTAASSG